jgi:hypothetical protein
MLKRKNKEKVTIDPDPRIRDNITKYLTSNDLKEFSLNTIKKKKK